MEALQTVTGLLPAIAINLDQVVQAWVGSRPIWAPERRLLSYEDRNEAAAPARPAVRAGYVDLKPLSESLRNAVGLTTALSSELAERSQCLARLPHLSEAQTTTTNTEQSLATQAESGHRAVRRARAQNRSEWALPTQPRTIAASDERIGDPLQRARLAVDRAAATRGRRARQPDALSSEPHDERHADQVLEAGR